jgi:acyl carrier protein
VPADRDTVMSFLTDKMQKTLASKARAAADLPDSFNFMDADLVDSLGFVSLVQELEQQFQVDVDLSDADPEQMVTLGGLADMIARSPSAA